MNQRYKIDLVMPDLFDDCGGIARVGRVSAMAYASICAANGMHLSVHVLRDRGSGRDVRYLPEHVEYFAYRSSRARLASAVIARAFDRAHLLTIFYHVNLAATRTLVPASFVRRGRYVVVGHGVEVWNRLPLHRRLALQLATEVWAVSEYSARRLVSSNGVDPRIVRVIPNALDPYLASSIASNAQSDGGKYVLAVSRLSRDDVYKGVDVLLQAFFEVAPEFPNVNLVIVGDGNDLPRLKRASESAGLEKRVEFRRRLDDAGLAALYGGCTLFALPSKKEGFGLVMLEAMSAGKPVIAAAAGGTVELIDDGRSGILVAPDDHAALTRALRCVLADESLAARLGNEGRRRATEAFGYHSYQQRLADALASITDRRLRTDGQ